MRLRVPVPSSRVVRIAWVVVALVFASVVSWLIFTVLHQSDQAKVADAHIDSLAATAHQNGQTARQAKRAAQQLAQQVRNLGGTPTVNPSSIPGPTAGYASTFATMVTVGTQPK